MIVERVGLYGVVAHGVTERTHEIGVRIALGVEQRHVPGLVVRQGLTMALLGTAIGVAGSVALSRWIQGLLFGVTATDPFTIGAVVATTAGASFGARRSVFPIQATRTFRTLASIYKGSCLDAMILVAPSFAGLMSTSA